MPRRRLATGTAIHTTITSTIDTKTAYLNQPFTLAVQTPYPNGDSNLSGATITGHVIKIVKAAQGRNAQLELAVTSIKLAGGSSKYLNAKFTNITEKKTSKLPEVAAGTLAGMALGNMLFKTVFQAKYGGVAGAVAGYLITSNDKPNFTVPSGSSVDLQLLSNLTI